MEMIRDIFISHNGADSEQAQALCDLLKSRDPELNIFLDCGEDHPLEQYEEWMDRMLKEAANSRYLIFLASRPEYLEEGNGWVYPEVLSFAKKSQTRKRDGRADRTIAWFGILLDGCPLRGEMYQDPKHGEQYRLMYDGKEHLCLPEGCGVEDAAQQIWDKFRTMVEGGGNAMAAELLVKVHAFAEEKAKVDPMFRPKKICDGLIPKLQLADPREGENWLNDSNRLIAMLQTNSVVLLGSEGGSGKTSLLTKLFYHHLPQKEDMSFFSQPGGMIPLYVDAKTLAGKDNLIRRHLARTLYDEDSAVTSEFTGETVDKLGAEFAQIRPQPRYLLLIDGYNEIPVQVQKLFDSELAQYLPGGRYQNVRVLIASRHMQRELPEEVRLLRLRRLERDEILAYLKEQKLFAGKLPAKLLEILSTPMYLKLYAQTRAGGSINSKGDLLTAFVKWQQEKVQKTAASQEQKAVTELLLLHFLPLLAYRLMAENTGDSTYLFQEQTWEETAEACLTLLESRSYKKHYGTQYREILSEARERKIKDELDLMDQAQEYLVKSSKLLRKNEDGSFEFIHQIYRDFFCAWFVAEELKRTAAANIPSQTLDKGLLPEDVREFTAELLQEEKPVCTPETWQWDYGCNDHSLLLQLLRQAKSFPDVMGLEERQAYTANLVELLKQARDNDLSGCDFSGLDLRRCDLRSCVLNRWDAKGSYPASFSGAWLDRENLICDSHLTRITAGCIGNGRVASMDRSGVLRIWVLPCVLGNSEKIITGVDPRVEKLVYAPEGDRIYAMTPHEILELPIPEERESVAQTRVLLKTAQRLRNILLDGQKRLCFTTVFNAFNPKPVTDPEAPDIRDFYGLNSAAAVNATGTQLAFGHVADAYQALRIYDLDPETGTWVEKKFGYFLLLDGFMAELEQTVKELGLYDRFPDDFAQLREAGEDVPALGSYFEFTRRQFYDRSHDLDNAPCIIYTKRIRDKLALTSQQKERLEEVVERWSEKIRQEKRENPLLMGIVGRRVETLDYRGEDQLLLSCLNEYQNPNNPKEIVKDTVVVEINTTTMKARYISNYISVGHKGTILQASYWEGGMLLFSGNLMTVQDHSNTQIARVRVYETEGGAFFSLGQEGFLMVAEHFVYQFDPQGKCVAGWDNRLPPAQKNMSYVLDENGRDFLIRASRCKFCNSGSKEEVLDISTGSSHRLSFGIETGTKAHEHVVVKTEGETYLYKLYANRLATFHKGVRTDSFALPYKLFVQNCDFRGIRGTLAEEAALLCRMGALTDPVELPRYGSERVHLSPVASNIPFYPPEQQAETPYIHRPGLKVGADKQFDTPIGGEHLSGLKIWTRIYEGSYSQDALETADMSILEWTGRLGLVTPEMIRMLIRGGLVEAPVGYGQTQEALVHRLDRVLHGSYRLLWRNVFTEKGEILPHVWYSLTTVFGKELLQRMRSRTNKPEKGDYGLRRQLALNHWFCRMVQSYPGEITQYAFNESFESEGCSNSKVTVQCFLQAGDQPVFVLATRRPFDDERDEKTVGTLNFICRQVAYSNDLTRNSLPVPVQKPPVVVIIGEDYHHCQYLNSILGKVAPFVRKLYTYDALLHGDDTAPPRHFSFFHGQPMEEDIQNLM